MVSKAASSCILQRQQVWRVSQFNSMFPIHLIQIYRTLFKKLVITVAIVTTLLSFIEPAVNAFALMLLGIPSTATLVYQVKRCKLLHVVRLGRRCTIVLLIALVCWLIDRLACDWSWRWGFPSLHALWHLFICLGGYSSCVLLAYFEAINEAPEQGPVLQFWPSNNFELGIPYVFLKTGHKSVKFDDRTTL